MGVRIFDKSTNIWPESPPMLVINLKKSSWITSVILCDGGELAQW